MPSNFVTRLAARIWQNYCSRAHFVFHHIPLNIRPNWWNTGLLQRMGMGLAVIHYTMITQAPSLTTKQAVAPQRLQLAVFAEFCKSVARGVAEQNLLSIKTTVTLPLWRTRAPCWFYPQAVIWMLGSTEDVPVVEKNAGVPPTTKHVTILYSVIYLASPFLPGR